MGFLSFVGRILFASVFILSAWQMFNEFGDDGGPAAKYWASKYWTCIFKSFPHHNIADTTCNNPPDLRIFVATIIFIKGVGGLLFVMGRDSGAFILTFYLATIHSLMYDFYNYDFGSQKFMTLLHEFLQCLGLYGAVLFYLGFKAEIYREQNRKEEDSIC